LDFLREREFTVKSARGLKETRVGGELKTGEAAVKRGAP